MDIKIVKGDLSVANYRNGMLHLLDLYMQDPMGKNAPLDKELAKQIIDGLQQQSNYLFFLAEVNGAFAGLANCFINFSTFKAKQLINIHDFVVDPEFRKLGVGENLLKGIEKYGRENGFCRVSLEVRHDNPKAMSLYQKVGFEECEPPMYFWEWQLE